MGKVQEKQKEKRKALALKAIPIIDAKGFHNTTTKELCGDMGISVGTFYHYFQDKNDIIMEFFNLIDSYYATIVQPFTDTCANLLLAIRYFCVHYGIYCKLCGFEVCRQISIVPLIERNSQFISDDRFISVLLNSIVEQASQRGQLSDEYPSDVLSKMILNMLRGFCSDWCKKNGTYDITGIIDKNIEIYLKYLSRDPALLEECLARPIQPVPFDLFSQHTGLEQSEQGKLTDEELEQKSKEL